MSESDAVTPTPATVPTDAETSPTCSDATLPPSSGSAASSSVAPTLTGTGAALPTLRLDGRTAVVTGGSRGIGHAIALALAQYGADVAVIYAGRADAAETCCEQAVSYGVSARSYQCDVADFAATRVVAQQIATDFGHVDILVNNAGIIRDNLLMRMSETDFDEVIAVNLKGAFNMTHHLMRSLLRSPAGRIINITSVSGLMGNPGQANYAAAKAGLVGFTKTVAREVGSRKVTCNAIAPGLVETDMTATMSQAATVALGDKVPLKRPGQVEDIAAAALFLASDMAAYITGEVLRVDGGMDI